MKKLYTTIVQIAKTILYQCILFCLYIKGNITKAIRGRYLICRKQTVYQNPLMSICQIVG